MLFWFNTKAHNVILNGSETEQKKFSVFLPELLIFLKIVVDHLMVWVFFLMVNFNSLSIRPSWKTEVKKKIPENYFKLQKCN